MNKSKSNWGSPVMEGLKYNWREESKVTKSKMTKEELEIYLKELEIKNKYKNGGFR